MYPYLAPVVKSSRASPLLVEGRLDQFTAPAANTSRATKLLDIRARSVQSLTRATMERTPVPMPDSIPILLLLKTRVIMRDRATEPR